MLFDEAAQAYGRQEYDRAEQLAQFIVGVVPEYWQGFLLLASIASRRGEHFDAIRHLRRVIDLNASQPDAWITLIASLNATDQIDEIECTARDFANVWRDFPLDFHVGGLQQLVLFQTACRLDDLGRRDAAERLLLFLESSKPEFAQAVAMLGMFASERGEKEIALVKFARAIELLPEHPTFAILYASALKALNRVDDARRHLQGLTVSVAEPAVAWFQLGFIAWEAENYEESIDCFQRAVLLEPARETYHLVLAEVYRKLGMFDAGEQVVAVGLRAARDIDRLLVEQVDYLVARGRVDDAIERCHELLKVRPDFDRARRTLIGLLGSDLGEAWRQFALLDPATPEDVHQTRLLEGRLLVAEFRLENALEVLEAALAEKPNDLATWSALLRVHIMRTDVAAARRVRRDVDLLLEREGREADRRTWRHGFLSGLLTELAANQYAADDLKVIRAKPQHVRALEYVRGLQAEPGYMGYPLSLLVHLRRTGAMDHTRPTSVPTVTVPKTLVQFWSEADIPDDVVETMFSWASCNPSYQHLIFNDKTAEEFIEATCSASVVRAFRTAAHPAMRADLFRLAYLAVEGGIYADADDLCRRDVTELVGDPVDLVLLQEDLGSIGNNFIAAAPGHPFIIAALRYITQQVLERDGDNIWFMTGPGALSMAFCQHYASTLRLGTIPEAVKIVTLYQLSSWICAHLPRRYKADSRHWVRDLKGDRRLFRSATTVERHDMSTERI